MHSATFAHIYLGTYSLAPTCEMQDAQVAGQLDSDDSLRQPLFRSTSASQQAAIDWDGKAEVEESELEVSLGHVGNYCFALLSGRSHESMCSRQIMMKQISPLMHCF